MIANHVLAVLPGLHEWVRLPDGQLSASRPAGRFALRAGAVGFLLKDGSPEQLLEAVHSAASGERLFSAAVLEQLAVVVAQCQLAEPEPGVSWSEEPAVPGPGPQPLAASGSPRPPCPGDSWWSPRARSPVSCWVPAGARPHPPPGRAGA
ncbi:hypothetical protein [Actinomyces wuliandei]|uniref:hypothetical protein n=1 Tax=Actinomyces wuliandei TaxID=2057743 RepID=UPI0027D79063|nr:hypothetical protein [Actinomyces wuliandei]